MKIVLPDYIDLEEKAKNELKELGVELYGDVVDEPALIERIRDAEIITANYADITKAVIDAAPRLKYIIVPAVGYEWVDYKYARTKGIKVLNCPTHNAQAVAEYALALLFTVQRKIIQAVDELKAGKWNPKEHKGIELAGTKLGLVGHGKIGRKIEKIASAIGMDVTFVNSKSSDHEWANLFASADVVCVILPLTNVTRKIVGKDLISRMKKTAILINVGRGATVDNEVLRKALENKDIAGAGVDVYEDEPLSGSPPKHIVKIAQLKNVVATPHIAYNSKQTSERLGKELVDCIESCLSGSPINVVN